MIGSLWVAGVYRGKTSDGHTAWELLGLFDNEDDAAEICTTPNHFIGPCQINKKLPDQETEWPGCYYPKAKEDH